MSEDYSLIELLNDHTLPVCFSSAINGRSTFDVLASGDLVGVFEEAPLNVAQCAAHMSGQAPVGSNFKHPYILSVLYRKSRNPHGPSSRPVYIVTYEYSYFTCSVEVPGFFGKLFGEKERPREVFMVGNSANGRNNAGKFDFNFSREQAMWNMAKFAQEALRLVQPFKHVGSTTKPWDPQYFD